MVVGPLPPAKLARCRQARRLHSDSAIPMAERPSSASAASTAAPDSVASASGPGAWGPRRRPCSGLLLAEQEGCRPRRRGAAASHPRAAPGATAELPPGSRPPAGPAAVQLRWLGRLAPLLARPPRAAVAWPPAGDVAADRANGAGGGSREGVEREKERECEG